MASQSDTPPPDPDDPRTRALAGEVLRYLERHPNAADTIDGIAQWWLSTQRLEDTLARVQAAVDQLVAANEIEALPGTAGRPRYRRRAPVANNGGAG